MSNPQDHTIDLFDPQHYLNRDLSWLEFNRRVLAQAQGVETPLLDRVRFLIIFTSNLDEFFMKRIALLQARLESGWETPKGDRLPVSKVLERSRELIIQMQLEQANCWQHVIRPELEANGVFLRKYRDLPQDQAQRADEWFMANIFPILTPLAVDPGHRFPFISNLSESLGIVMASPETGERMFARLKIPETMPRLIRVDPPDDSDKEIVEYVAIDDLILNNLNDVFPGMDILDVLPFRLTRSAVVDDDTDEIEDLLEHVEDQLRQRRFGVPIRLETSTNPSTAILDTLLDELDLSEAQHYPRTGLLEWSDLAPLLDLDRPDLKRPAWRPVVPSRLREEEMDIFSTIRERDLLVHHPYDSFNASVERFIAVAASDPNVLAIKQTLYRTSRDSPFVQSLIHAAEEGKQVACLVELRARFDEDKNVEFARQLEKHGVHVAYGVVGYKTHSKCSLIVRKEQDRLRTYAHVGTGNYHPGTAQLYTDLGLLTCDPAICDDLISVFNYLTGRSLYRNYRALALAPHSMRNMFLDKIEVLIQRAKAGTPTRIVAKMNALEDGEIIRKLYQASNAGVQIDLVVRGFCCLRPGVPGLSENIRIRSIVGRFLEHSRVFCFLEGDKPLAEGDWYIGSADWMSRNLDSRVEVATPVRDEAARLQLAEQIQANLDDRLRAWVLRPDGVYEPMEIPADADPESPAVLGSFEYLCRRALERA